MITGKEQKKQTKDYLQRLLHYLNVVEDGLLVLLLSVMILVAVAQILLRNIGETGISWGDPLLRILVLWLGLLGAMVATRQDSHISIDLLTRYLSARVKRMSDLLASLFTLGVCALLAYHGGRFVLQDQAAGVIAFANLPAWWFELIIPLGFTVMSLRYAMRCVSNLRELSWRY
jgi:TRAP-type C4-dicarboxylate transport system permease small subunit